MSNRTNIGRRTFLATSGALSALALLPACGVAPPPEIEDKLPRRPPPTDDDEYVPGSSPAGTPQDFVPDPSWKPTAENILSRNVGGQPYTEEAPGPFAGKERSHVPVLTIQMDGVAVIVVNHVMDAGGPIDAGGGGTSQPGTGSSGGPPFLPPWLHDAGGSPPSQDAGATDGGVRPKHWVTTIWCQNEEGDVVFMKSFAATDAAPPFVAFRIPVGSTRLRAFEHCNLHGAWASKEVSTTT